VGKIRFVGYRDDKDGPIYKLVEQWKVALPLHAEYGTEPNVFYVPPINVTPPPFEDDGRLGNKPRIPLADIEALFGNGVQQALERAGRIRSIRLHGDCHAGNILWTGDGPHFVDLDDARMGPAVQDLWMLLPGEGAQAATNLRALVAGYEQFFDFERRELLLIEALRTLRLLHYSAWIARRWNDPAFPAAFPWFGTQRYWQDRVLELREQTSAMDEAPLSV